MHVQKTTQIGRKGTLLKLEFRLGSINLEDLSGPEIFFSFSLNSVNNRCLGVRGHSFHSSGRSALLPDVDENTDVLGLRCGHLRCGQKMWASQCPKSCTSHTLLVELMTRFSQMGEAAKASVRFSIFLVFPTRHLGSVLHPVATMDWPLSLSGRHVRSPPPGLSRAE